MPKRAVLAIISAFVAWSIPGFLIHGMLLQSTCEATAHLWRPMDEMNMPLMYFVTLVFAICFVAIYGLLVERKSLAAGIQFGGFFGLTTRFRRVLVPAAACRFP